MEEIICKYCNKKVMRTRSDKRVFCSTKCSAKYRNIDETNHPRWKGESCGYVSLHKWVAKHKGKPNYCVICHTTEEGRYEWANISGEYLRNLNDWERLCVPCHRKKDDVVNKMWITRRAYA